MTIQNVVALHTIQRQSDDVHNWLWILQLWFSQPSSLSTWPPSIESSLCSLSWEHLISAISHPFSDHSTCWKCINASNRPTEFSLSPTKHFSIAFYLYNLLNLQAKSSALSSTTITLQRLFNVSSTLIHQLSSPNNRPIFQKSRFCSLE